MARDIALNLREEAIAAADIDASDDENSSEIADQTEMGATAVTNNWATEAVDVAPVESAAMETESRGEFSTTTTFDNQPSRAQADTHIMYPTVPAKRPRGRPRKRAPDTVAEREVGTSPGARAPRQQQ
ncbi:unnamed protein product [Phytophthora fragariaefolia]|uniref:Unnamed protein product n=1 Tax=Phytophthora fragariaefolia TaxID=1490495 RepID=A0A9W6TWH4_9STRA|nr:unnamed protein product [Phytophthora fragariaefolia]